MDSFIMLFLITALICVLGCIFSSKKAKKDKVLREAYYKKIFKEACLEALEEVHLNQAIDNLTREYSEEINRV